MNLPADLLKEPDRCRVANAKVPRGHNRHGFVIGHVADPPVALQLFDDAAVIAADDRSIEAAEIFLIEDRQPFFLAMQADQVVANVVELFGRKYASRVSGQFLGKPILRVRA